MYFGATAFSAAPFSDVGFNPNAYVNVTGQRLNVNIGNITITGQSILSVTGNRVNLSTGNVTIIGKAREVLSGNGLELGIGNAQASIPKDVPVTGNGFELGNGTVTTTAGAKPIITGNGLDLGTGQVTIIGKCNLSVTGNGIEIALGNATAKANATAIVTGKRFNVGTSDVTVIAKAKALPSGEGFEITKGKKDFIIVGLPYVDNEEIRNYGEYVIKILPKFFGESRIEISDSNLVSPKLSDRERASAEYLKVKKIVKGKTSQFDNDFKFIPPVNSVITSQFGKRRFINGNPRSPHMALDISCLLYTSPSPRDS